MTATDMELFFFTMICGVAGLGVFILVSQALTNFLKQPERHLEVGRGEAANGSAERPGTAAERRRGSKNVPTITCSLPIPTQGRSQQRLW